MGRQAFTPARPSLRQRRPARRRPSPPQGRRRARRFRQSQNEREARCVIGPPARRTQPGRNQLRLDPVPPELGAHLESKLLARGELNSVSSSLHPDRLVVARRGSRCPSTRGPHPSATRKRTGSASKSPRRMRLTTVNPLRTNRSVTPCRVVVGSLDQRGVLHEVDAEQESIARRESRGNGPEQTGAAGRVEVPDRTAEERDQPALAGRDRRQVPFEVADDGVHADRRVPRGDCLGACPQHPARSRRADERSSVPGRLSASRSSKVFSDVPAPSSTSVRAPERSAISADAPRGSRARSPSGSARASA